MPPDAANVCEYAVPTWPFGNDAVVIASEMAGDGIRLIVAFANAVEVATLVAVNVNVWAIVIIVGAVYEAVFEPVDDSVPTPLGLIDHVTPELVEFWTVAANVCDWP